MTLDDLNSYGLTQEVIVGQGLSVSEQVLIINNVNAYLLSRNYDVTKDG